MSSNQNKIRLQEFEVMSFVMKYRWGGQPGTYAETENEEACRLKTIAPTCMTCMEEVCGKSNDGACTFYDKERQPFE